MFDASAYAAQLRALLPQGRAWNRSPDSMLGRLLDGIAQEFARIDARADDLLDEADPRTALELLPDWERVAGLPDACFGQPDNIPERQVAVASRITGLGGQSRAYFIELAASLGYLVEIEEFRPARCGDRLGVLCHSDAWVGTWRMHILPNDDVPDSQTVLTQARCGDRLGVRLRGWGSISLECLVNRHKPAHTRIFFTYQITPEALFWFDFT